MKWGVDKLNGKLHIHDLILEVTRKCNMSCKHCLRGPSQNVEMTRTIVDTLLDQCECIDIVSFNGGEPSLNLDIIRYFFQECERRLHIHPAFGLATNGKEHQLELACILAEAWVKCDYDGRCISGLGVSKDAFHDDVEDCYYLKALAFYTRDLERKTEEMEDWIVAGGNALINGLPTERDPYQSKALPRFNAESDGTINVESLLITAEGAVLNWDNCELSYERMQSYAFTSCDRLYDFFNKQLQRAAAHSATEMKGEATVNNDRITLAARYPSGFKIERREDARRFLNEMILPGGSMVVKDLQNPSLNYVICRSTGDSEQAAPPATVAYGRFGISLAQQPDPVYDGDDAVEMVYEGRDTFNKRLFTE